MLPKANCDHSPARWEVNQVEKYFTRRCAPCGDILERLSFEEAYGSKVRAIQTYLREWRERSGQN